MVNEAVAAQLCRIVTTYGPEVCEDPRRVEALLRDLSGEHRREISVLSGAAREGIPAELLANAGKVPAAILGERLVQTLQDNLGMGETAARWAVAVWASALDLAGFATLLTTADALPDLKAVAPGSSRSQSAGDPAPSELVVAPWGRADHRTISDALSAAGVRARIVVRPGVYRESLTISQPVELVADGPAADVVIEANGGSCVLMQADHAVVRGFTLRGQDGAASQFYGVDVAQGELVLDGCDISSTSDSCVAVHGAGTSASIKGCRIHDSAGMGVLVEEQGAGLIEDCEIWGNARTGVGIGTGGNPTVRRCKIHDGQQGGVFVFEQGAGVIEDCEIWGNAFSSVEIKTGGNPTVRRCKIHDEQGCGVYVLEQGAGVIEDCEIWGNKFGGVTINTGGSPTIRRCKIRDGQQDGVIVSEQGAGVIEDCEIWGNAFSGVEITTGGNPTIRRCKIRDNHDDGVWAHEQGAGMIEACTFSGNWRKSVRINRGCKTTVR